MNARVAQSVERSAVNRKVGGSNPPVSDIFAINIKTSFLLFRGGSPMKEGAAESEG